MIKLLVIADDFTGALDTGIQFKAKDTRVLIGSESVEELAALKDIAQVVIVDAETRHMSPEAAHEVVYRVVAEATRLGIPFIYKKTDSGLRGNIGAELGAAMEASGKKRLHFIPAFPIMGRTTKEGIHYVNGTPVSESAFRNDPFNPVTESFVPDIIHQQTEIPASVYQGNEFASEEGILVYDAQTNEDLAAIAKTLQEADELALLGGCAGFASALPELLCIEQQESRDIVKNEGYFFLCGSVNPTTIAQVEAAKAKGFGCISLKNAQKLDDAWMDDASIAELIEQLKGTKPVMIESFSDNEEETLVDYAGKLGFDTEDIRVKISTTLGALLKKLIDAGLTKTFMVTGGDTLLAFMNAIGEKKLEPVCELKPGVVLSKVEYQGKKIQLISKSGGFGKPELLSELNELLSTPILAITSGDPAGSGPEITARTLAHKEIYDICRPLVIGDTCVIEQAIRFCGLENELKVRKITEVEDAEYKYGVIDVYDIGKIELDKLEVGKISAYAGEAAFHYVKTAIELALAKKVDGTITNAISKEAINLAGYHYSGHTEIYADFTGTKKYCMMLALDDFRVTHVSTHVSLAEACRRCKKDRILEVIELSDKACKKLGIENPRVAVAGLNPHCGEHGMFGMEEIEEITPAIEAAKAEGINAIGPCAPDTVFSQAAGGWYDIVVCMYHDQGHIPTKVQGFVYDREKQAWNAVAGVNITLGTPIVRVSVDHGTAYDHAGKGDANELSLMNSIEYGAKLASDN